MPYLWCCDDHISKCGGKGMERMIVFIAYCYQIIFLTSWKYYFNIRLNIATVITCLHYPGKI